MVIGTTTKPGPVAVRGGTRTVASLAGSVIHEPAPVGFTYAGRRLNPPVDVSIASVA